MSLLDPQRIQDTICRGKDIFGMLPEAFNVRFLRLPDTIFRLTSMQYVDLLAQINPEP